MQISNASGTSPFVLVCDHASNHLPERYGDLGLTPGERQSHIAWDPGALAVSRRLVVLLDAPLVFSTVSRLIIDTNRVPDAEHAIWTLSEATRIAANENLSREERDRRVELYHRPYHDAITALLDARAARGVETVLVCMHSFTPVYLGVARPWPIGLIHGVDTTFTRALRDGLLAAEPGLNVGWNQPYSALSGVTYTLEHHGDERGLTSTMIEIRNDEIDAPEGVERWAALLAQALRTARSSSVDEFPARRTAAGTERPGR